MTAGKEIEGRTVTDRLNRLSILYSEDIFLPTIRRKAKSIPSEMKQEEKLIVAGCKMLWNQGIRTLKMSKTL